METAVNGIQNRIRLLAVLLPPIPALLLGLFVLFQRLGRELKSTPAVRRPQESVPEVEEDVAEVEEDVAEVEEDVGEPADEASTGGEGDEA